MGGDSKGVAESEGTALAEEVTLPEVSGTTLTLFPGQAQETELDFGEFFPGADEGDLADYTDLFGSDLGAVNAGQAAEGSLLTKDRHGNFYAGFLAETGLVGRVSRV